MKYCLFISFIISLTCIQSFSQNHFLLPYNHKQWQFENSGANGLRDIDIDLPDAWRITTGGLTLNNVEIVIAIIDRGVETNHEDLKRNIWVNQDEIPGNNIDDDNNGYIDDINGWNFYNNSNDISNGGYGSMHGSAVNGIIGADGLNSVGVSGINKSIKLLNLVRGGTISSLPQCFEYILELRKRYNETNGEQGAFIVAVNNSWGIDSCNTSDCEDICELIDELGQEGILSVVAAPNENINVDIYNDIPSSCFSDFVISVTNTDKYDNKIHEAGYGINTVDIAAPGQNSYTTLNLGRYGYFGGTSAATCYITGTIGLLYSVPSNKLVENITVNSKETALRIKSFILESAISIDDLTLITTSGGRLNVYNSIVKLCEFYSEDSLLQILKREERFVSIYPNHTIDYSVLSIELRKNSDLSVNIYNENGLLMNSNLYINIP